MMHVCEPLLRRRLVPGLPGAKEQILYSGAAWQDGREV